MGAIPAEELLTPKYLDLYMQLPQTAVWKYMCMCLETPRPSGSLDKIRQRLKDVADRLGLEYRTDAIGNVVIARPGGPGFEKAPTICVQSHLDMVASKHEGFEHDFENDPIDARVEGEFLRANGTTLGGDDGAGVAACLALLEEESPLPPLECLFTVEEETDMSGAENVGPAPFLTAKTLINVDSEEMNAVCVGCAGGFERTLHMPVEQAAVSGGEVVTIKIEGLTGGHSGVDIMMGGANAVKIMARVLDAAGRNFRLANIRALNPINTIPRECFATIVVDAGHSEGFKEAINTEFKIAKGEYAPVDPNMAMIVGEGQAVSQAATKESTVKMLGLIDALPHGVQRMSLNVQGSPETSVNLAICELKDGDKEFYTHVFCRSNLDTHMKNEGRRYEAIAHMCGARIGKDLNAFPGWEPDMTSRGLQILQQAHRELFNKEPRVYTIHAGLECGLIQQIYPGMDCASIGPTIEGAHTPDERMKVATVDPFFTWLITALRKLSA